jgi:hypothetical protein
MSSSGMMPPPMTITSSALLAFSNSITRLKLCLRFYPSLSLIYRRQPDTLPKEWRQGFNSHRSGDTVQRSAMRQNLEISQGVNDHATFPTLASSSGRIGIISHQSGKTNVFSVNIISSFTLHPIFGGQLSTSASPRFLLKSQLSSGHGSSVPQQSP